MITQCRECSQVLNEEEIHYYESRCEQCEIKWMDRIKAWRDGGEDKEFDLLYGDCDVTKH